MRKKSGVEEKKWSEAQEVQFVRLRLVQFGRPGETWFDGAKIAKDLEKNASLWDAFVFGRFEYYTLVELRDLPHGVINADTLVILTTKERLPDLLKVVGKWGASEIGCTTAEEKYGAGWSPKKVEELLGEVLAPNQVVVRIWWD